MTSQSRSLAGTLLGLAPESERHIVDQLIQERAPSLLGRGLVGILGRTVLYPLLGYREAVRVADGMVPLSGLAAMEYLQRELDIDVRAHHIEHLPPEGAALVVSNHPTGIADGVVVFDVLTRVRRDLTIFTNRDAVRVTPGLADICIPVEWVPERRTRSRTRETLQATQQAFADQRLVVLFPSGRLAYMDEGHLRERPWMSTVANLARRHRVPVIPMHIAGRNSRLFYTFSRFSDQLRDITLFHEVTNKRRSAYDVTFAPPIAPERLAGDAEEVTAALQRYVESAFTAPLELPEG